MKGQGDEVIYQAHGDILKSEAEAIVNPVNCVGVMGRGLALQFRRAFADNYVAYREEASAGRVRPGRVFVFERAGEPPPRLVINFPTKRHWKDRSRIGDIESGLADLARVIRDLGVRSVAVPALGCGLGGLDWFEVRPLIERVMSAVPWADVHLFGP